MVEQRRTFGSKDWGEEIRSADNVAGRKKRIFLQPILPWRNGQGERGDSVGDC